MTVDEAVRAIGERLYPQIPRGDDHMVVAMCGIRTGHALKASTDAWSLDFVFPVAGLPEGEVYILTEGALRGMLADWPQADVLEIGGE
jgi:hypothetical protein